MKTTKHQLVTINRLTKFGNLMNRCEQYHFTRKNKTSKLILLTIHGKIKESNDYRFHKILCCLNDYSRVFVLILELIFLNYCCLFIRRKAQMKPNSGLLHLESFVF